MMKVEKMIPSKNVKDQYYIDLENGETLKININIIADYSIYTGRELSNEELEHLRTEAEETNSRARALRILGQRMMSRREIINRLMEKGETEKTACSTADWLESIGALNDVEYASSIVRHYSLKGYGIAKIKDELYRRGIDREMWDEALSQMSGQDDIIDRIVYRRLRGEKPGKDAYKRTVETLLRRGFSWDAVKAAMSRYANRFEGSD